jgi:hypothetical protein
MQGDEAPSLRHIIQQSAFSGAGALVVGCSRLLRNNQKSASYCCRFTNESGGQCPPCKRSGIPRSIITGANGADASAGFEPTSCHPETWIFRTGSAADAEWKHGEQSEYECQPTEKRL